MQFNHATLNALVTHCLIAGYAPGPCHRGSWGPTYRKEDFCGLLGHPGARWKEPLVSPARGFDFGHAPLPSPATVTPACHHAYPAPDADTLKQAFLSIPLLKLPSS